MIFGLKVAGLLELRESLEHGKRTLKNNIRDKMGVLVQELAGEAQRNIHGKRASNPPEVLGVVTGRLRQSIAGRVRASGAHDIVGEVGPQRTVYGRIHEIGGKAGHATIPARPYLAPALAKMLPRIQDELGDAIVASIE